MAGERARPMSRRTGTQGNAMPAIIPVEFEHGGEKCTARELSLRQYDSYNAAIDGKTEYEKGIMSLVFCIVFADGTRRDLDWWMDNASPSFVSMAQDALNQSIELSKKKADTAR